MAILPEGEVADWLKERKEALGTALDLRDLRGKIKAAQRRTPAHKDQGLPVVSVSNRQLREVTTDALSALVAGNDPVTLFVRSGTVVRLRTRTHKGFSQPIIDTATPEIIRCHQSRTADYIKLTKDGNTVAVSPPLEVAKDILAVGEWEFPPLDAVTETPVLRPDGSILSAHGYDPATKLYYCPDPSLILPDVPEVPTPAQLHEAISLLADVIYDFPFVDGSDFANALAIMLTPVVRPAVDDCVPLAVITAPQPGTGKGLLAKTCAIVSTGRDASMMTAPVTTEEWKKSITTQLSEGATSIVLDNIELPLADPNLAAVLTASIWKDRQLGTNRQIEVPNRSVWVATGNNVKLGGDLPRRCYWIRLDPKTSEPEKRRGFRHTNLISYVTTNRGQILAALLTLCRHWFALGCPGGKGPIIGSFERWCQVIGGILSAAGVEDFMGNADTQRKAADEEGQRWLACLEELFATYSPGTFTVNQLNNDCISDDNLLASIPDEFVMTRERSEASFVRRLGRAFGKIDGKRFGPENLYIEKSGLMNCKTLWEVKKGAGDGGAEPIDPLEKLRRKVEPVAIDDSQVQGDEPGNPAADSGQIPFDSSDNVESGGKSNSLLVLTSKIQPRTCKTNISPPDRDIYVLHATGGKLPLQTSKLLDSADCEPKPAETGISSECDAESLKVTLTSVLDKLGWPSLKLDPWMRLGIGGKPTWLLWMNHPRTDSIDIWQVLELLKGGQE
jgi:hypothetical protein